MKKYNFPNNFLWGTASSATQMEGKDGKCGETVWDYFYKKDPIRFYDQVGPQKTTDFYNRYKEDIKLMKEIGLNSFRTSISWARLFLEKGIINNEAVEFYNNIIDE